MLAADLFGRQSLALHADRVPLSACRLALISGSSTVRGADLWRIGDLVGY